MGEGMRVSENIWANAFIFHLFFVSLQRVFLIKSIDYGRKRLV